MSEAEQATGMPAGNMALANAACPCCGGSSFREVLAFPAVPLTGWYRRHVNDRIPPAIDLRFESCEHCGLLRRGGLATPVDYADKERSTRGQLPAYRETLLQTIARSMAHRAGLVVEIGSNDGAFLELLRQRGYSNLLGIEPAHALAELSRTKGLRIECGYFGPEMVRNILARFEAPAAVICRHTLEHVPDPAAFVSAVRDLIVPHAALALIEVPDSEVITERLNFVELWDEHLYYFTPFTMRLLLERLGFSVDSVDAVSHLETRNIVVCASAQRAPRAVHDTAQSPAPDWKGFAQRLERFAARLRQAIASAARPVHLIGASHPQCNFVNFLKLDSMVQFMIDDDPAKAGKFPPVRGEPVSIIDTARFISSAGGGSLVLTGFGYPGWTARLRGAAAARGVQVIDPRHFIE